MILFLNVDHPAREFSDSFLISGIVLPFMSGDTEYTVNRLEAQPSVKLVNFLIRMGRKAGLKKGELNRDEILDSARKKTGLHDLGNERYVEVLDRLIDNAEKIDITPLGRYAIYFLAQRTAMNRLHIENYIKKHPEVEDISLKSPVIIVGFPRTGTTLLQNVLSTGTEYRALYLWELATPYPLHEDPKKDREMRIRRVDLPLRLIKIGVPEMTAAHDIGTHTKEECWILLANTLALTNTDIATGLHEWNDWLMAMDRSWVFEEYKRMLQLQAHITPTGIFVLKCPSHLWNLEPILKVFPDACIVWAHRNPVNSIASFASLMGLGRRVFFGRIDTAWVGEMMEGRFHSGAKEVMRLRDRMGDERFYDINFETLIKDIPKAVGSIRDHFGLPHGEKADTAVRAFLERPRKDKPGKHSYSAEQFGLDEKEVVERFKEYIERFEIKVG